MRSPRTVLTPNRFDSGRRSGALCIALALCAIAFGVLWPVAAGAQVSLPPGPPGPPPGAAAGLPSRPATTGTPGEATGPPATIPAQVIGPGLRTGVARVRQSQFALAIACRMNGRVSVVAAAVRSGALAQGRYVCVNRHATAQLRLRAGDDRRLAALGTTLTNVTLREGNTTVRLSVALQTTAQSPSYWSDGGLQCSVLGAYEPYLVGPNFTTSPPAVIDVRPWVAWYTDRNGWRWLGTGGVNASRWYRWTAAPNGIEQWRSPAGALNPWTWAPIRVHPGDDTYAIGAFEVVYWYAHPLYTWMYTRSSPGGASLTSYCSYP